MYKDLHEAILTEFVEASKWGDPSIDVLVEGHLSGHTLKRFSYSNLCAHCGKGFVDTLNRGRNIAKHCSKKCCDAASKARNADKIREARKARYLREKAT